MFLLRVSSASLNVIPFDWEWNKRVILNALRDAKAQGATIVALPELCVTGYECEDDFLRPHLQARAWELACEIAEATKGWGMIFNLGLPVLHDDDRLYNCSAMVVNGEIKGLRAKLALADGGNYYEGRQFKIWPRGKVDVIHTPQGLLPIGDIYFRIGNLLIGFEVCEESWKEDRISAKLKQRGVKVIISPNASHFSKGKFKTRKGIIQEGSRSYDGIVLFSNTHGCNGRLIFDGGPIIADGGQLKAIGKRFSHADHVLVTSVVDIDLRRTSRASTGSFYADADVAKENECVQVANFKYPEILPEANKLLIQEAWETSGNVDEEEAIRGPALANRDWLMKARLQGCMVSLSGGRDSSLAVLQVTYMVQLGVDELGFDGFKERFSHVKGINECQTVKDLVNKLLTCAYFATENSGEKTKKAARGLAEFVGARYFYFGGIGFIVRMILWMFGLVIGRNLSWENKEDDIPLQNVQARVRAVFAWLIANVYQLLLICTSNRTEGSTGYWTAGGDGEGGQAPLAGMDKKFICEILEYLRSHGLDGYEPLPILDLVLGEPATAELQPAIMKQTDEDQLGPFPVLKQVETDSILHNRSPLECLIVACAQFPQFTMAQMNVWVGRWFTLWARNQWKREQATAGLHTDTHNVDPRCGRRAPILSGGFRQEIGQMNTYVSQRLNESQGKNSGENVNPWFDE
jgi:NAD+ synthase (glutamine-hydrolysing)